MHEAQGGEPFGVITNFSVFFACFESEDTLDEVHPSVEIPFEGSYDVFKHEESPSLGCSSVLPNPLDHSHASPLCLSPSPSPEY